MNNNSGHTKYSRIRELIDRNRISDAENSLEEIHVDRRDAEWYFLMGFVNIKLGYYFDAQKHLQTACSLEPNNVEYMELYGSFQSQSKEFYKKYNIARKRTDIFGHEEHPINRPCGKFCDCYHDCCDVLGSGLCC